MASATCIGGLLRLALVVFLGSPLSVEGAAVNGLQAGEVVSIQGTNFSILRAGSDTPTPTREALSLNAGDVIRTGTHTRVVVRIPHRGEITLPPETIVEIERVPAEAPAVWLRLWRGLIYFFHRGDPGDVQINSAGVSAAIRGTEFTAEVDEAGRMIVRVVDGRVVLSNAVDSLTLQNGEKGVAEPGTAPVRTRFVSVMGVIQWCLYYPGVLDADEIPFSTQERAGLAQSLRAYREGDLVGALASYPQQRRPQSAAEQVYLAGILLSVGEVKESQALLDTFLAAAGAEDSDAVARRLAGALETMMAVVHLKPGEVQGRRISGLASEWLARSYVEQAQGRLDAALQAAQLAVRQSPGFGLGWVRVAELQFGFGRLPEAKEALGKGLERCPRHGPATALRGFLSAAENRLGAAEGAFREALALDSGLGNAWLGLGLCRIRQGAIEQGLEDLELAGALEPQRAFLRSYLAKAYAQAGQDDRAEKEFRLAKELDPNDPTAWLYAALWHQQNSRINEGIGDLEASKALNRNRRIYRSSQLLDEDRAVRGANLAALYQDAGMIDLARREAVEAVESDYGNFSAHLFLANSYNALRDPNQVELRYETAWLTEYLLANLLAPVGAGILSQTVSQQEYSRLFERDRLGLVSTTDYWSNGDWTQAGVQHGRVGNLAYALEAFYRNANGQRLNNDSEQLALSAEFKGQLTPRDSLFLQTTYYDAEGGDLTRVYDPEQPDTFHSQLRFQETQKPLLLAGYHHEWRPGQHTLFLFGRLHDRLELADPRQTVLVLFKPNRQTSASRLAWIEQQYESELEIYSWELQHVAQWTPHTVVAGLRQQWGEFDTQNLEWNAVMEPPPLPTPLRQDVSSDLRRLTAYAYYQLEVAEPLRLIAGLAYDHLTYPANHRSAPVTNREETAEQLAPKLGAVWTPSSNTTFRVGYSRSLGGVSLDQSFRLEPSEVAGFNQAWRALIPESVAGAQAAPEFETWSLEWDQRFPTRTYLAARGDLRQSTVDAVFGVLEFHPGQPAAVASETPRELDYDEKILTLTANQLVGQSWSFGLQYRLSQAALQDRFPQIPENIPHIGGFDPHRDLQSTLHQLRLFALLNHPSGFFADFESIWSQQSNHGYDPDRPGDDFWHLNVLVGYRFPHRRAEVRMGILNLTDRDYRLNPLNLTPELPRDRTFTASLAFHF